MPDETPGPEQATSQPADAAAQEPLRELTLGRPRTSPEPPKAHPEAPSTSDDEELEVLAARCRAKAEAARWAAERQRRLRERDEHPDEDGPTDPAMRQWAEQLTDAFYWASTDDASVTPDSSPLDHVGGCFEAVADGLLLEGVL